MLSNEERDWNFQVQLSDVIYQLSVIAKHRVFLANAVGSMHFDHVHEGSVEIEV